jgi:two-component system NarL family response regulator
MAEPLYRVFIADDHSLFRESLTALVSRWESFRIVGDANSGEQAVRFCKNEDSSPDIVLMDITMPGIGGLEAARQILADHPDIRVVMLTMSNDESNVFEALSFGAKGYISKDVCGTRLRDYLLDVMNGEMAISSSIAAKVLRDYYDHAKGRADNQKPKGPGSLTPREKEVLQLLVEGLSNSEIGKHLHISEPTVKKDLARIMDKLQQHNRVQTAVYALRQGLCE